MSHELIIEGMSCGHCVMAVKKQLSRIEGVSVERVDVGSAQLSYDDGSITVAVLAAAVEEAGFRLREVR